MAQLQQAALLQQPLAPMVRHATFASFYNDLTLDPCKGQYARIMGRFEPEQENRIPAEVLLEQALGAGCVPQAYLCCAATRRGPRLYVIHLPARFTGALDGHTTPWDNNLYAFLGEVTQGMATTVVFPTTAFNEIEHIRARSAESILQSLDAINGTEGFPPVPPNDPTTVDVSTRYLMYLPARYVPLLLDSSGYTIKQVWEILYPALLQNQDLPDCTALLNWLQASSSNVQHTNPQGQVILGPPVTAINIISPPADRDLIVHRSNLLNQALPGLKEPSPGLEAALSQMAVALMAQTNDARVARDQREAQALEPKLPSDKFTVTLPVLMEYTEVRDERELPLLWHQWANCTKKQEFNVLKDVLDTYARSPEAFSATVPIVTPKLVQDLISFTFVGDSADDIKTGLHPFVITDGSSEHRQANLELSRLYGFLNSSETGVMLADLEALRAKEVRSVPLTYWELEKTMGMFGNLLGVVLGNQHPLTTTYRDLWNLLRSGLRDDLHFIVEYKGYIKPTHILRSVQLHCYSWFNHKRARLQPPLPDFAAIVRNITLQVYVLPHLPPALYQLAYPKQPKLTLTGSTTSTQHTAVTSVTHATPPAASLGDASVVSGLTQNTTRSRTFQANLNPDQSLQQLLPSNVRLKHVMGSDAPPRMDDGTDMCLSFHLRNGCWATCKRVQNHHRTLSTDEKQRLTHYLLTQLTKQATPPPGQGQQNPSVPP
jgi:hypothetical protein